jgi:Tol biopolymer transport system component
MKSQLFFSIGAIFFLYCCAPPFLVSAQESATPGRTGMPDSHRSQKIVNEIKLEPPIAKPIEGKYGQSTILNSIAGRLAYTTISWNITTRQYPTYLVLRTLKSTSTNQAQPDEASVLTYLVKRPPNKVIGDHEIVDDRQVFDPQFSPDGRYILFKYGGIDRYNLYRLYVLDTVTNQLKLVSDKQLSYSLTSWSPDGNYIAFVERGDFEGGVFQLEYYVGPLCLYVCNWRTGEEHLVFRSDSVRGPFSWLGSHTLMYGALSDADEKILKKQWETRAEYVSQQSQNNQKNEKPDENTNKVAAATTPQPNIYEYSVEDRKSKLLFKDGYRPEPSPDGKWIAFFGSEHPDKPYPLRPGWQDNPQGAALSVARLDGTERVVLNRQGGPYPFVYWLPGNQRLLTLEQIRYSSDGDAQAQVKVWDLKTKRFRIVSTLQAKDFEFSPRSVVEPQFRPRYFADDSSTLFISVHEYTARNPDIPYMSLSRSTMQAVNLLTGKITPIAQIQNAFGLDWHSDDKLAK